jgi:hypothetical protein
MGKPETNGSEDGGNRIRNDRDLDGSLICWVDIRNSSYPEAHPYDFGWVREECRIESKGQDRLEQSVVKFRSTLVREEGSLLDRYQVHSTRQRMIRPS